MRPAFSWSICNKYEGVVQSNIALGYCVAQFFFQSKDSANSYEKSSAHGIQPPLWWHVQTLEQGKLSQLTNPNTRGLSQTMGGGKSHTGGTIMPSHYTWCSLKKGPLLPSPKEGLSPENPSFQVTLKSVVQTIQSVNEIKPEVADSFCSGNNLSLRL